MRGNARLQPRTCCARVGLRGGPECGVGPVCGCACVCVCTCRRCSRAWCLCTSASACAQAWSGRLGHAWGLSGCSSPGSPLHCSEGGARTGSKILLPAAPAQSRLCPLPPAATGRSLWKHVEAPLGAAGWGGAALAHLLNWRTRLLGSGLNISSASFCEPQFPHL